MNAPPTSKLVDWVVSAVGAPTKFAPCGWPQGPSRVWRLDFSDAPSLYLKQFGEERKREQEIAAFEWVDALRDRGAALPTLRAMSDPDQKAIILTGVAGEVGTSFPLDEHDGVEVHRRAGAFLAAFHCLPFEDLDPMPLSHAIPLRLAFWIERGGERLSCEEGALARDLVGDGSLFAGDRRVPCHRDYQLRNWLLEREAETAEGSGLALGVIDFEHARPDHPLVDFVRVEERAAPHYPHWFEAFILGYEQATFEQRTHERSPCTEVTLESIEEKLRAFSAIHAVGSVVWGHCHGDQKFERAGHELLSRLRVEYC